MPAGAGKGSAALHCAARLGVPAERMMVAGDGENDLPLFEATAVGAKGLLVGNACAGLSRAFGEGSGKPNVTAAARDHAYGILDGLFHHFIAFGCARAQRCNVNVLRRCNIRLASHCSIDPTVPRAGACAPAGEW